MKAHSLSIALQAVAAACLLTVVANARSQSTATAETAEPRVVITKLSPPVYPPLARQAHITGDVVVQVSIGKDGSIESVELFDGHPMLARAALDSAKQSTFVCQGCEATTSSLLTYTFGIAGGCHFGPNCEPLEPLAPQVTQSEDKITLTVEPSCICDPVGKIIRIRVRAAKCLYLWKCGLRDADDK
jgi:TonB family protein